MESHFEVLRAWQVAVCKVCRYAIWPAHIKHHLTKQHRITAKDAQSIQIEARNHQRLIQDQHQWEIVHEVSEIIPELQLYPSAQQYTQYPYVGANIGSIRRHWSRDHLGQRGRRGRGSSNIILSRPVQAQRMFIQGPGSNYFRVNHEYNRDINAVDAIEAAKQRVRQAQRALHPTFDT